MRSIYSFLLKHDQDVVTIRQKARQIAGMLGFDNIQQTRITVAVSEITGNAFKHACDGKVEFLLDEERHCFVILITDRGKGIHPEQAITHTEQLSDRGSGIINSRKLMNIFQLESLPQKGTRVMLGQRLPRTAPWPTQNDIERFKRDLSRETEGAMVEEIKRQNQDLIRVLHELEKRQEELGHLNQELAETNRGVVALYAELEDRAEHLKRADEIKTRFLSNMSHEFRTPVHSSLNLTRFLLDRSDGELTREQEKQVRMIRNSLENLSDLVNDLLDLAKVQAGKVTIRLNEFALGDFFGSLRGMFRPMLTNPQVKLRFDRPTGIPALYTDEGKLAQILRNFISNALKFTEAGEVRVKARYDEISKEVILSVEDSGIGIKSEDTAFIFEEFSQIEHPLQRKVKGTGLGLPLSRKLAELLGGHIDMQSTPGKGSIFSLTLPIQYSQENFRAQPCRAESVDPVPRKPALLSPATHRLNVLIIDDDESSYYILKRALQETHCIIHEAKDHNSGLILANDIKPDIVFLDLVMPGRNGFETLVCLKENPATRGISVVLHSSKSLSAAEKKKLKPMAYDFFAKNDDPEHTHKYIQQILSSLTQRRAS